MEFSRELFVVTGGTRGIGGAVTRLLVREGATVVAIYLRQKKAVDALLKELDRFEGRCIPIKLHLGGEEDLTPLIEKIKELGGRIRGVVANAASGVLVPLSTSTVRHWEWTMAINVLGHFRLLIALKPFLFSGSSVVGISSPGAVRAIPSYGFVGVSKGALEAMLRQLALEWGGEGIRVNIVRPGVVLTEALDHFPNREELIHQAKLRTPRGRLTEPEEVAEVVRFLLSERSGAILGATIVVDGGAEIVA
jgi:enoyl-[acyl-carrier protein] reductase III